MTAPDEQLQALVQRLRAHVNSADLHAMDRLMVEAAHEIERLQREVRELSTPDMAVTQLAEEHRRYREALENIVHERVYFSAVTAVGYCRQIAHEALAGSAHETPAIPDDWQLCEQRPTHSIASYHRGRWVDGELRCWDCPATWRPAVETSGTEGEQL